MLADIANRAARDHVSIEDKSFDPRSADGFRMHLYDRHLPSSGPRQSLVEGRRTSPEVPLGECASGPGLQIALEVDRPRLVRKFDGDVKLPRAVARGVRQRPAL